MTKPALNASFESFSTNAHPPTTVEKRFLQQTGCPLQFEHEKVPSVAVSNAIELGKLTALRFLEWVCENPDGVIALPTGKSPEFFIKFLTHYKNNWKEESVQKELRYYGLTQPSFPDTRNLKFVQLDEFFPIDPTHRNSFYHFVREYYLPLLEIKTKNALLINAAKITDVELFCIEYEQQIDAWGGIGFFLGGIGPDGHIAFNMFGSAPDSKTRLVTLNYKSACGAASSLGGMKYARDKTAITIGLDTITRNKNATIIIIAAGEGKAPMVAHAIEKNDNYYPASTLQRNSGTRFYLTHGAVSHLRDRYLQEVQTSLSIATDPATVDRIIMHASLSCNKPIVALTKKNLESTDDGAILARQKGDLSELLDASHQRYVEKITASIPDNASFMHTAPHHDDVMLSYHPMAVASLAHNKTHVAYATSGFNAVTKDYLLEITNGIDQSFLSQHETIIFSPSYETLLHRFADAYRTKNSQNMFVTEQCIVAQHIASIYACPTSEKLLERIEWITTSYLPSIAPGEKDDPAMQQLKGIIRETEVDRMWYIHGLTLKQITHLRSKFYTGDYFTPQPTFTHDVTPMLQLLHEHTPDIVTVAFDPEGTGPDTHYKVLQVVAEAISAWGKHPTIWGYRNVWYRFEAYDATLMSPVSHQELDYLHDIFMHCFSTQKEAAFPSHLHDGPFSELSVTIQKEQLQTMKTLLGKKFFENHKNERIRSAAGLCFIKKMTTQEFLSASHKLREYTELVQQK